MQDQPQSSEEFSVAQRFGQERPQKVLEMIQKKFERVSQKTSSGYGTIGDHNYEFSGWDKKISSRQLINAVFESQALMPLWILDIGTGNGLWLEKIKKVFRNNAIPIGLTASDFRDSSSTCSNEHYVLGNAETMIENGLFENCHFHFIISAYTFMHLVDPLAAISQAYERLQPGGVLCIDSFYVPGINGYLPNLIDFLNQAGYQVAATFSKTGNKKGKIDSFFIQKTHPHLNFPITYQEEESYFEEEEKCEYQIDYRFIPMIPAKELDIEMPKPKEKPKSGWGEYVIQIHPDDFIRFIKFPLVCEGFIKLFKEEILGI